MNRRIMGPLLLLIIGAITITSVKLTLPHLRDLRQRSTSDAVRTQGKICIAMDNWMGYFPLRSNEMKILMRRDGWILKCEDDKANYAKRMERLKRGEIDFAVATVDSFILNAKQFGYPGTIVMVIDESKGGDAIIALKDKVPSLDSLKGRTDIRVAFTPDSPSHHLAKAAADHFNVPELLPSGSLRIETEGSEEALKHLIAGKTDVAILWEPDVSKALSNKKFTKILGTEDTAKLIVDILIVNRNFAKDNPVVVQQLLRNYFKVLKKYRDNPDLLVEDVRKETGLSQKSIDSMLKGVKWVTFSENCESWFGIAASGTFAAHEGLIDTIDSTVNILVNSGDFSANPIPGEDPYRLTNSSFLKGLFTAGFITPKADQPNVTTDSIEARFSPLDEAGWNAMKEVGTLKIEPIHFQSGATELDMLAKKIVDEAVERLKHYPNFRVVIKGHTGTRGDSIKNKELSQYRAEAVAKYLETVYNVDSNRLHAIGLGSDEPLPENPGETFRSWQYRLSRAELVLVREVY